MNDEWLKLQEYHVWANSKLLSHLRKGYDVFTVPFSSSYPTIARTFGHIYDIDINWFNRMRGNSPATLGQTSFANVDEALSHLTSLHRVIREYLASQDGSRIIHYCNTEGVEFENRLSDMLLHMVNHGTYHRGNVTAMLHQGGLKSCATDYIYFLREKG